MKNVKSYILLLSLILSTNTYAVEVSCSDGTDSIRLKENTESYTLQIRQMNLPDSLFEKLGATALGRNYELKVEFKKANFVVGQEFQNCRLFEANPLLFSCSGYGNIIEFTLTNLFTMETTPVDNSQIEFSSSHNTREYLFSGGTLGDPGTLRREDLLNIHFITYGNRTPFVQGGGVEDFRMEHSSCAVL